MSPPRLSYPILSIVLAITGARGENIAPEGTPIFGIHTTINSALGTPYDHVNPPSVLNDGGTNAAVDSWIGNTNTDHSYIGVVWDEPRDDEITTVTVDFATFLDGGWFGQNGQSPGAGNALDSNVHLAEPTVQVTNNGGASWSNIAASSNYPSRLDGHEIGGGGNPNPTGFEATWTLASPQSGINGIRLIGPDGGNAGADANGFLAASEIEIEAASVVAQPTLSASPVNVAAGGSSTLSWDLPDGVVSATLSVLGGGPIQNISGDTGSAVVTPDGTTSYVLEHGADASVVTVFSGESLVITEFMASNDGPFEDEDGDAEDWIEIYNASTSPIDAGSWGLTDDATSGTSWRLPPRTLAPGEFLIVFASGKNRAPASGELHTDFKLDAGGEGLELRTPDGQVASQFLSSGRQIEDVSFGVPMSGRSADPVLSPAYFRDSTPGVANGAGSTPGPLIGSVTRNVPPQAPGSPLVVTAEVSSLTASISSATLHHRQMFGAESSLPMRDDGTGGDVVAGDGIYSAIIPGSRFVAGEMVRWFVTATESTGETARRPRFEPPTRSDQYYGTIGESPVATQLPVLHWFLEDPAAATAVAGTRASVYYGGEFYDNIFSRRRGHFGSSTLPKKSFKFDFNDGDHFRFHPDERRVDEINLNTTFSDKAYIRRILAWDLYEAAGVPGSMAFMVRVHQNGSFWGLSTLIEQPDRDLLRREPLLDDDGALYKMFNEATSATSGVEKKTRRDESNSDLAALVAGVSPGSPVRATYLWDNVDVPAAINFLAASRLMHENDDQAKNYYLFRNTTTTGEWTFVPWDKDLTWGRNYTRAGDDGGGGLFASLLNDTIWADNDTTAPFPGTPNASPSHPLFGDSSHTKNDGPWCRLSDAILDDPAGREMYLRRLRTLMDELLQTPETPAAERVLENRIEELHDLMAPDVADDRAIWANPNPPFGVAQTFRQALDVITGDYLPRRRQHFFENHTSGESVLVDEPADAMALVPFPSNGGDALGLTWTQRGFVPSAEWISGPTGVGFEASFSNRYDPLIGTDLIDAMDDDGNGSRDNSCAFIRIPFSANGPQISAATRLELQVRYDDGFVAYVNGVEVASDNAPPGGGLELDGDEPTRRRRCGATAHVRPRLRNTAGERGRDHRRSR